ncbi:hypothetical protein QQ045_018103 [Rhodiola kirilowii]
MEGVGKMIQRESGIEDLPDSVLERIVNRLSLPEAVRAGLVARPWRHFWKSTKEFTFDDAFYNMLIQGIEHRWMDVVVNSILSRHVGLVDKFKVCIRRKISDEFFFDISQGITILSKKKVKYLKLEVNKETFLRVPSEIYNFSDLRELYLKYCWLLGDADAIHFTGYPDLYSLRLFDVDMPETLLGQMLSLSPQLNQIDLVFFSNGNPVELNEAALTNLASISYRCKSTRTRPLCLTYLPSLTRASFETRLQLPGLPLSSSKLDYFAALIPHVKELSLDNYAINSLTDEVVPTKLSNRLRCLDDLTLEFFDIGSDTELSVAFCLIRNAPNLKSLRFYVNLNSNDNVPAMNLLSEQLKLPPLRKIHHLFFVNLANNPAELKLIKTLIKLSPSLKTVFFKPFEGVERREVLDMYCKLRKIRLPKKARFKFERVY